MCFCNFFPCQLEVREFHFLVREKSGKMKWADRDEPWSGSIVVLGFVVNDICEFFLLLLLFSGYYYQDKELLPCTASAWSSIQSIGYIRFGDLLICFQLYICSVNSFYLWLFGQKAHCTYTYGILLGCYCRFFWQGKTHWIFFLRKPSPITSTIIGQAILYPVYMPSVVGPCKVI